MLPEIAMKQTASPPLARTVQPAPAARPFPRWRHAPEDVLGVAAFCVLAGVVFLQFFSRYVLGNSVAWTEEIARYLLIVTGFLGAVTAVREGTHIRVEFFYRYLPASCVWALRLAVALLLPVFFGVMAVVTWMLAQRTTTSMVSVDLPKSWLYFVVCGAFAMMCLRSLIAIPEASRQRETVLRSGLAALLAVALAGALLALSVWGWIADSAVATLFGALFFLLVVGMPIAAALTISCLLQVVLFTSLPTVVIAHRMINGLDSFPLLAIPFFILAGALMNTSGVTERLFDFAKSLVGWMRGGLGHVNVGASVIFSGMSGAAVADAGGLGAVEIKAMREAGYDAPFSVGLTAASSTIGPIIPPSLPMVIFGVAASTSVGQLFLAGIVPGLLMAAMLMVMVHVTAIRRGYGRDTALSLSRIWNTFRRAFLSLLMPVIIVGGIGFGLFTPTEAAIAAAAYALFLGTIVYRSLSLRALYGILRETFETTATVLLIVAAASVFSWFITSNQVPQFFASFFEDGDTSRIKVLLMINGILLVVGCFMETIAAITILVPILLPVALAAGVDPVHLGVIMVLNLMIGLLTPPVGMVVSVLARVSGMSFERCMAGTLPFLVPLLVSLLLVTFWPGLSLWLPSVVLR
ncbi:TRAP transporter large permease subunit [Oceanicola sp. 502str15]|uniref:TRAP transporter large permease n=1 Tax=Oceanicola sp. 502str15 TaxID=2696061 RepID=UPI002095D023|nr:TRAP transporter large permease subunit [Oceanicola sp. 502str15]MCO6384930.1 TRAP transporter large permease subunit [Oceanicola sp. 502str15]